jgi:hypothetical protein
MLAIPFVGIIGVYVYEYIERNTVIVYPDGYTRLPA